MEGWALHWEMLLWDQGFTKTPEDRIGALFWRMHRCARIIFSLSFHLGKMTAQECVDFLVNRVGLRARERSRRSAPLVRVGILRAALSGRLHAGRAAIPRAAQGTGWVPGKMTDREFHDAILKMNAIPVEMVRASLTKQPLEAGFGSGWKFCGPLH